MALTAVQIKNAKPAEKPLKISDGGGLYLLVNPNGSKYWRMGYRFNSIQKTLALGVFPSVSLLKAREMREEARKLLAAGTDPSANKKAIKSSKDTSNANSFEIIAREWHASRSPTWAPANSKKVIQCLERDIFPWLGASPIKSITSPELLMCARRMEERGAIESARRALLTCGQVFRYGVATARCDRDPVPDLRGALQPAKPTHFSTMLDPRAIGALLRAIEAYTGSFITRQALRLAPLVFVRPGNLRAAEWSEIDLDKAEWSIPADKMKMREPHLVPLSTQALAILREIHPLTGRGKYVFPSEHTNTRCMSENTINFAFRRMDFTKEEISCHGFRAMARTLLDEVLGVRPDFIEHQLAHAVRDPNGRAYNRTSHIFARKDMMQRWSNYLDSLKMMEV
ncbi:MAG: tyrosine-type recombinase/integrase [Gammaproteobacteria bacterium]